MIYNGEQCFPSNFLEKQNTKYKIQNTKYKIQNISIYYKCHRTLVIYKTRQQKL